MTTICTTTETESKEMSSKENSLGTALFSVTNKEGLQELVGGLREYCSDLQMIASGNTARVLREAGFEIQGLEERTGFPECFGGRVKTLHPKISGGILFDRTLHSQEAKDLQIAPIDLVVCNLYDFKGALKEEVELSQLIEQIDVGGPTMIRSAAKNYASVTVMTDPRDYPELLEQLKEHGGCVTLEFRKRMAAKAFALTAQYDQLIAQVFGEAVGGTPPLSLPLCQGKQLRYGENPDQKAWVYSYEGEKGIANGEILGGKALSYNNYEDASMAYGALADLVAQGETCGAVIVKHGSPCGIATGQTLAEAFEKAWEGDRKSAFGSVIAVSAPVTEELQESLRGRFIEVLIAPEFSEEMVQWLKVKKPQLRLVRTPIEMFSQPLVRSIKGGVLVQTPKQAGSSPQADLLMKVAQPKKEGASRVGVVTNRMPSTSMQGLLAFALVGIKHAKSNAVVLAREYAEGRYQLLSVGTGQPNRVDSLQRLAIPKALENLQQNGEEISLKDCVLVSDGFFPFPDSIEVAHEYGIQYCVQPGGGKRDEEVISVANEKGLCMMFTGERYFNH